MTPRWVVYDEPAGGGPWDPSQLSSTSIWVDIDSLGLSNGSGITTLTDRTSNNYDLSGSSTYATVVSGGLNGLDAASFTGTNGYKINGWPGPFGNDGFVFAAVVEIASASNGTLMELRVASQLSQVRYLSTQELDLNAERRDDADTSAKTRDSLSSSTGWAVIVVSHDYTTGAVQSRVNGTTLGTTTLATTGTGPENNITVSLGSTSVGGVAWQLDMAEAIWFDDSLSTGANGNLERVEGYLAHRYALQSKLPVSHPYKNAAP